MTEDSGAPAPALKGTVIPLGVRFAARVDPSRFRGVYDTEAAAQAAIDAFIASQREDSGV